MASTRISAPMRSVTSQLSRLSIRQDAIPKALSTSFARPLSTSASSLASVSTITTSADAPIPTITPLEHQTVLATIHHFPSLEPLRFEAYPANHLYLPTRRDLLHRAIVYEGDKTRLGTASTKTRYEVRGSARKIRPQKGSGRARLGDKKSPMLKGGGVAFGPKPRDFSTGLQKKVYDLAWRTALSYRFRKGELVIVDNAMEIESPSPRLLDHIFNEQKRWNGSGTRSLLVTLQERPMLERALDAMGRGRQALTWENVDVKDLLELGRIMIERDALKNILLSHQEDLTHSSLPPSGLVRDSAPEELEDVMGWAEFRDLMAAKEEDRKALRPDAYESVADKRWYFAETIPDGPEKTKLKISSLELSAEAKELRAASLNGEAALEYQSEEKISQAEAKQQHMAEIEQRIQRSPYHIEQELPARIEEIRATLQKLRETGEVRREYVEYNDDPREAYDAYEKDLRTKLAAYIEELKVAPAALEAAKAELTQQNLQYSQLCVDAAELIVEFQEIKHERLLLQTEALESRVEVLRLRGQDEEADELWTRAGEMRAQVQETEAALCDAKVDFCERKAHLFILEENFEAAQEVQTEAEAWLAKAEELRGEQAGEEDADEGFAEELLEEGKEESKVEKK